MNNNFILGTAGHIDHGKSSLIKALTGIETDRLEEEKKRGISIVLGYADMRFPSGISAGIVDVPGHAKFIKTMVSGSTGMDGVLLVIAADDGIMAQTKEHMLILKLLGIRLVIPVITKTDAVSSEILAKRESEVKQFLKAYGYEKYSSNIFKVSTKSGKGIEELKENIEKIIQEYNSLPQYNKIYNPTKVFLPIDRIISSKGFGTILAGTLKYGTFKVNDEIQIMPQGITARVKSIESHNKPVDKAFKSMRISLNVPSVKKENVKFGYVISEKNSLIASDTVLTKVFYDFENKKDLKSHINLMFMTGTSSVAGKIIVFNHEKKIKPGEYSYALFKLNGEIASVTGEKFIIRDIGAGKTIGGGTIIDSSADYEYSEIFNESYEKIISDNANDAVYGFIEIFQAVNLESIYKKFNLNLSDFFDVIERLKKDGKIITDKKNRHAFTSDFYNKGKKILTGIIEKDKKIYGKTELFNVFTESINAENIYKEAYKTADIVFDILINDLLSEKYLSYDSTGNIIPKGFEAVKEAGADIPPEYADAAKKIEDLLISNGNSVPDYGEIERKLAMPRKTLNYILSLMLKSSKIVKVKHDMYYLREQIDFIKLKLDAFFDKNEKLEPKDIKEIAEVSRKYAIPLLEYFDGIGYTVKKGEYRIKK
ncbi:MAG: selenocysteine-specific translation elongation factor [Deltaproteobacteria bacterium]|jgi:selenocysteine-specific elongation factor|nr:selenocysteine-specific translation elongation factor [Deltaproteobacteria bacterium]